MVYENIKGRPFEEGFAKVFQEDLGMASTFPDHPPAEIDVVIPCNDSYSTFTYSLGLQWP
jgi:hypothetical protein